MDNDILQRIIGSGWIAVRTLLIANAAFLVVSKMVVVAFSAVGFVSR